MDVHAEAREAMVRDQLAARKISDPRVLEAFRTVPRHLFVPEEERDRAYQDRPLGIGFGQTISQPYMVACMTEALGLSGGEKVLEIGTGSGYQAAILLAMGARIYTIERIPELAAQAEANLAQAGLPGARVRLGDGTLGWPDEAPFDRVVVTAGAPTVPIALLDQLREGGTMAVPVGTAEEQELLRVRRQGGRVTQEKICACVFVKLLGREGW